jgi:hypothetical protein
VPEAEPAPVFEERDFYFPPDTPPVEVSERDLLLMMRDWRHGRATRTLRQTLSDGYMAVISVLVLGAMLVGALNRTQALVAVCESTSCVTGRTLLPWVVLFGVFSLVLSAAHLFGPVLASAAEGFWLMEAPIRRGRLLGKRLVLPLVLATVSGAVLGTLITVLTGSSAMEVVAWGSATGFGAFGLMGLAAAAQTREARRLVRGLRTLFSALAAAAGVAVICVAANWVHLELVPAASLPIVVAIAAAGLVLGIASTVFAVRRLDDIRRARLMSGGALVSGMQGAAYALDLGLIRDILVDRETAERGHVRATKGRGTGLRALIWRDVERLYRWPKALPGVALSLLVPYALDALGLTIVNPLLSALALVVVLVPLMGSLRVLTRTKGLARSFPFATTAIRQAAMVVPLAVSLLWALAAVPAFYGIGAAGQERSLGDAFWVAVATGAAGLLGAVRWVTAKPIDFNSPMVATGAGAMQPTLIFNLLRGIDVVAIVTAPLLIAGQWMWSLGFAAIAFWILRGTFDMDELKATQQRAQREQAELKAEREKVRIKRPTR